jgi:hypothetical protein
MPSIYEKTIQNERTQAGPGKRGSRQANDYFEKLALRVVAGLAA